MYFRYSAIRQKIRVSCRTYLTEDIASQWTYRSQSIQEMCGKEMKKEQNKKSKQEQFSEVLLLFRTTAFPLQCSSFFEKKKI